MQTEKIRTIRLYGILGTKFGRVHQLAVNSAAEAIRALSIMVPGFERFLAESKDNGFSFAVFIGGENIDETQLRNPPGSDDIRIAPVIEGSKRGGIFQTIVGVALMVASIWYPPCSVWAWLSPWAVLLRCWHRSPRGWGQRIGLRTNPVTHSTVR